MYYFCTYFDRNYLPRGLALYRSLQQQCPECKLWVLCMDGETYAVLTQLGLPGVEPIALPDFEAGDNALLAAKQNRSQIEYYFTCTPSLPLYVLNHWPEVDLITYLDADLFFFASPAPLFAELGTGSIAIIGHRFTPHLRNLEVYGLYNVGWLSFRRDEHALACLNWWRAQCIEWCYDRLDKDNDRFADQKYLNDWPSRFQHVVVLGNKGANVAPWNVGNYHLQIRDRHTVMVDETPLIFFHFHGLKQITAWVYDPNWTQSGVTSFTVLRKKIYNPYLRTLHDGIRQLLPTSFHAPIYHGIRKMKKGEKQSGSLIQRVRNRFYFLRCVSENLLKGKYIGIIRFIR